MHVQIELFGGPEDGREITVPINTQGVPVSPLPIPSGPTQDVAWYEKHHQRTGVWIYRYSATQPAQSPAS